MQTSPDPDDLTGERATVDASRVRRHRRSPTPRLPARVPIPGRGCTRRGWLGEGRRGGRRPPRSARPDRGPVAPARRPPPSAAASANHRSQTAARHRLRRPPGLCRTHRSSGAPATQRPRPAIRDGDRHRQRRRRGDHPFVAVGAVADAATAGCGATAGSSPQSIAPRRSDRAPAAPASARSCPTPTRRRRRPGCARRPSARRARRASREGDDAVQLVAMGPDLGDGGAAADHRHDPLVVVVERPARVAAPSARRFSAGHAALQRHGAQLRVGAAVGAGMLATSPAA